MTLISCPELLKHFLFWINSDKEEVKAGIRLHCGWLILIFLQSCSRKTSWHVSPPRSFQCEQSADRLFKCYSQANLVPALTHQLPHAWKANRLCSSLGDPSQHAPPGWPPKGSSAKWPCFRKHRSLYLHGYEFKSNPCGNEWETRKQTHKPP